MELFLTSAPMILEKSIFGILILIIAIFIIIFTAKAHQTFIRVHIEEIQKDISIIKNQVEFISNHNTTLDQNFSSSQKELNELGKTIKFIQTEMGARTDEMVSEQKINNAIDMAKLGSTVEEISLKTGLDISQVETIIRFHTSGDQNS